VITEYTDTLRIVSNGGSREIALKISMLVEEPGLLEYREGGLPITTLEFGSVAPGDFSDRVIELVNIGTGAIILSSLALSGSGFSVTGFVNGAELAPAGSTSITVRFTADTTTNYVEVPIRVSRARRSVGSTTSHSEDFRGRARIYESGTIHLEGNVLVSKLSPGGAAVFKVWVGASPTVGRYVACAAFGDRQTSGAAAAVNWYQVDWVFRPAPGENVYFLLSANPYIGYEEKQILLSYPEGLVLPAFLDVTEGSPTSGHRVNLAMSKGAGGITVTGTAYGVPSTKIHFGQMYALNPVSIFDPTSWAFTAATYIFGPSSAASLAINYTRAWPTLVSGGISIGIQEQQSATSQFLASAGIGPYYEAAPVIQSGPDPYFDRIFSPWPQD
jgi:hypothetical protein